MNTWFTWCYRLLLHASPSDYRRRYGDEALRVALARVASERGPAARCRRMAIELADAAAVAWRERWMPRRIVPTPGDDQAATAGVWRDVRSDVRLVLRRARATPWSTSLVVATLALAIAATTTTASVLVAVVWRPLPFDDPGRLMLVRGAQEGRALAALSAPEFRDLRERTRAFEGFGGMWETNGTLAVGDQAEPVHLAWVTSTFFPVLGLQPVIGRHFTQAEDAMRGPRSVLISYELWQRRFGGTDDVLGQTLVLDDQPRTIVGVMPPGVRHYEGNITLGWNRFDLWIPNADWPDRQMRFLRTVGRLKEGVSDAQANADLATVAQTWQEPGVPAGHTRLWATPLIDQLLGGSRPALVSLFAAVVFVLAIACGNAGGVLRAQAAAREREIAVRRALGATRSRVYRMVIIESGTLVVVAAAMGLGLAMLMLDVLHRLGPTRLPRLDEAAFDPVTMAIAATATVLAAAILGAGPAVHARRIEGLAALHRGGSTFTTRWPRAAAGVAVGSIALAVTLLVGGGLMLRSLDAIVSADLGFQPDKVLTFRASISARQLLSRAGPGERNMMALTSGFYRDFRDRLRAVPGVEQAGAIQLLPFGEGQQSGPYSAAGADGSTQSGAADYRTVLPGYFEAMGASLVHGRPFADSDLTDGRRRVIVDRRLAEQTWPGLDPLGRLIRVAADSGNARTFEAEVVGVVEPIRAHTIREAGLPQVFLPYGQYFDRLTEMYVVVRTTGDPMAVAATARSIFGSMAPGRSLAHIRRLDEYYTRSFGDVTFAGVAISTFAVMAALIAMAGLFGVLSFVVSSRMREFGLRLALGADRTSLLRLVARYGMRLGIAGLVIGLAGGLGLGRLLRGLLFGVTPLDAGVIASVVALVAITIGLASIIPALRASRADPIVTMRIE